MIVRFSQFIYALQHNQPHLPNQFYLSITSCSSTAWCPARLLFASTSNCFIGPYYQDLWRWWRQATIGRDFKGVGQLVHKLTCNRLHYLFQLTPPLIFQTWWSCLASCLGSPQVWQHPCFLLLRWPCLYMEGTKRRLVKDQGTYCSHRLRYDTNFDLEWIWQIINITASFDFSELYLLGSTRTWPYLGMCFIWWKGLNSRV